MGHALPTQSPAVVLRSHYRHLQTLLAIALIAVVGLTIALVVTANDSDPVAGTTSAEPVGTIRYGGFNPATGRPDSAPLPQSAQAPRSTLAAPRYDGGPEEGTRDIAPAPEESPSGPGFRTD